MQVIGYHKGYTVKEVRVSGTRGYTDAEVFAVAMKRAHETESSLFGKSIQRFSDTGNALVQLHIG